MDVKNFSAYGANCPVYYAMKGEGLAMHGHGPEVTHGHVVIAGSTQVIVEGEAPKIYKPDDGYFEFPMDKKHSIFALEDNTIFINPIAANVLAIHRDPVSGKLNAAPPYKNRVLMADGTIVET